MSLKFISHNVQGFNSPIKRKKAFIYYASAHADVVLLQETHFSKTSFPKFLHKKYSQVYMANSDTKTKGVAICFKSGLAIQIIDKYEDPEGRFLALKVWFNDVKFTVLSYYAPNTAQFKFFEILVAFISNWAEGELIMGGDSNVVLDKHWDRQAITALNNLTPACTEGRKVNKLCGTMGWLDVWRELHPGIKQYTHYSTPYKLYARIDHIWVSRGLASLPQSSKILISPWSDHSPVSFSITLQSITKTYTRWRMNELLIKTPKYFSETESLLKEYFINNVGSVTSYATIWEAHKTVVRGCLIQQGATRKKLQNCEIDRLSTLLDQQLTSQSTNPKIDLSSQINKTRLELDLVLTTKAKNATQWTQQRFYSHSNKPTRLFARRLSNRLDFTPIVNLKTSKGQPTNALPKIVQEFHTFYKKLYTAPKDIPTPQLRAFFKTINTPKLTAPQKSLMENVITEDEVKQAIKTLQLSKAPGPDGLTALYYKKFAHILSPHLTIMFNQLLTGDNFSQQTLTANISPIPKPNSDLTDCKNFRPISVLNIDIKILAKVLAVRLNKILPTIIHRDQVGFICGRQAADTIRRLSLLSNWAIQTGTPSMLLKLDIRKAFDSVAWPYLYFTLQKWGFGPKFITWIKALYHNPIGRINIGPQVSDTFPIERGTRQGCPLSPLLFDLIIEPLAIAIRNDPDIHGFKLGGQEHVLSLFADDITVLITRPSRSLPNLYKILQKFGTISGLEINPTKTEALNINLPPEQLKLLSINFEFQWCKKYITVLGIRFTAQYDQLYQANYPYMYKKLQKMLEDWGKYHISWIGRINAVKMTLLPKLLYLFRLLPINIIEKDLKKFETHILSFVWKAKKPRVNKSILYRKPLEGGLGLPNLKKYYLASQLAQIPTFHIQPAPPLWVNLENFMTHPYSAEALFWSPAPSRPLTLSPCLKQTLALWDRYAASYSWISPHTPVAPIIGNPQFIPGIQGKTFSWWTDNKFTRIKNLLSVRGPYTMAYLMENYNLPRTEHYRALQVLHWAKKCWGPSSSNQTPLTFFERWCSNNSIPTKAISLLYNIMISPKNLMEVSYIKQWSKDLGTNLTEAQWPKLWDNLKHSSTNTVLSEAGYKVLFRWYLTPVRLAKIYQGSNELCFRGCSSPGTMGHIWWQCPKVVRFWVRVYNMVYSILHVNLRKDPYEALMGLPTANVPKNKQKLLNHILLAAKQTIAKSWKSPTVNFLMFKNKVDWIFINEKLTGIAADKLTEFQTVWKPWISYRYNNLLPPHILTL
uniref:Reverse transcriptase domain-containing protein n=1 Tax=Xenopus tropicalis TaxID=8364 RepID=A0A803K359_XENTR